MTLLILWDVDHTLVDNAGVSKLIYASAFQTLTGSSPSVTAPTEGRTDRAVMSAFYGAHNLPMPPWLQVEEALTVAGAAHADLLRARGMALAGAEDVLKRLHSAPGVTQSVLTGNIRANAEVKLAAFGLDRLLDLDVGGYGADAERRAGLVPVASHRFAARSGHVPARTVLVGDTPRDVEAALEACVGIIAVATGIHSSEALRAAGAVTVLEDLTDTDAVIDALRLTA